MIQMTDEESERIEVLAKKLGVHLPDEPFLMSGLLPILEALYFRIQELEHKVNVLDIAGQKDVIGL